MHEEMTTTTFTLEGYRIVESLGVVRGVTVRSRSLLGTIGARIETLIGGHIAMLTTLCERARAEAFDILLAHAQRRAANAIVGVRYDATEIMSGIAVAAHHVEPGRLDELEEACRRGGGGARVRVERAFAARGFDQQAEVDAGGGGGAPDGGGHPRLDRARRDRIAHGNARCADLVNER
jgi:uncharacterized protein YbjQ (UPF0145 family)